MSYIVRLDGTAYACENLGEVELNLSLFEEAGALAYRYELGTALVFKGDAYDYILAQTGTDICDTVNIEIQQHCETGIETLIEGRFNRLRCTFLKDSCTVEVDVETVDKYTCLLENYEKEVNILETPNSFDLEFNAQYNLTFLRSTAPPPDATWGFIGVFSGLTNLYGRYQVTTFCTAGNPTPPPPSNSAWTLLNNNCGPDGTATYVRPVTPIDLNGAAVTVDTTTCDLVLDGPFCVPPYPTLAGNWILIEESVVGTTRSRYWVQILGSSVDIQNNRELEDAVQYALDSYGCGLTFVSDLINAPTNPITGNTPNQLNTLSIVQKSDVVKAGSSEVATLGLISLKDLLEDLSKLFNARWFINNSNELVFEHISDVTPTAVGTDLTLLDGGEYARVFNTISFDDVSVPTEERFKNATDNQDLDFLGKPITYSASCTTGREDEIRTGQIDVEVSRIFQNEAEALTGFVVLAYTSLNLFGINPNLPVNGFLSGQFRPNAPLSWANLLEDYYKWDRPLNQGELNGVATVFNSTKKFKKQEGITFPVCCLSAFEANDLIRTFEGDGQIQSGSYSLIDKSLTVNLKFEL